MKRAMRIDLRREIAAQIKAGRKVKGWTQENLQKEIKRQLKVKISRVQICNYERVAVSRPTYEALGYFAKVLGITITVAGYSISGKDVVQKKKIKEREAIQLQLPLDTAKEVASLVQALNRGATITLKKDKGKLVLQALFSTGKTQTVQLGY